MEQVGHYVWSPPRVDSGTGWGLRGAPTTPMDRSHRTKAWSPLLRVYPFWNRVLSLGIMAIWGRIVHIGRGGVLSSGVMGV